MRHPIDESHHKPIAEPVYGPVLRDSTQCISRETQSYNIYLYHLITPMHSIEKDISHSLFCNAHCTNIVLKYILCIISEV